MTDKIEVNLKQAIEFASKGYGVQCFVLAKPDKGDQLKRRSSGDQIIYQHTKLMLSLKGSDPTKGTMQVAWKKTKKELWDKDATKAFTRSDIQKSMIKHGCHDGSCVAYLANKLQVLRRVNGEA